MGELQDKIQYETIKETLDINTLVTDFTEPKNDDPNVLFILSAVFGMGGAVAPSSPAVAGAQGFLSGMFSLLGNLEPVEPGDNPDEWENGSKLAQINKSAFTQATNQTNMVRNIVFGDKNAQDASKLPKEMLKQSFDNPIMNFFGDGQWLVADATKGLDKAMENFYFRMVSSNVLMVIVGQDTKCLRGVLETRPCLGDDAFRAQSRCGYQH